MRHKQWSAAFYRAVTAAISGLWLTLSLWGQASPRPRVLPGFRFDGLQARRVQAPNETKPELHWVLAGIPEDSQVIFPEEAVRNRVLAELAKWRSDPARRHEWLLDSTRGWNFVQELNAALKDDYSFILSDPSDLRRPPRTESSLPSDVRVKFSVQDVVRAPITSLSIRVATHSSEGAADVVSHEKTLAEIAKLLNRPAPENPEAGIRVTSIYAKSEVPDLGPDLLDQALGECALRAAAVLQKAGYRVGSPKPDAGASAVRQSIEQIYLLSGGGFKELDWPVPKADLVHPEGSNDWKFTLTGLQMARSASIDVGVGSEKGVDAKADAKLAAKARLISERLNERFATDLARLKNRIVTREELQAVVNQVAASSEVLRTVPVFRDTCEDCAKPALVLKPVARWNIKTLALKASGAVSPEDFVTGQLKASGDNLLSAGESESADFQAGPEVQKGTASLNRQWIHGAGTFGLGGSFNWANDFSQRLGGLSRVLSQTAGPKYELTDWTAGPKATARFAPALDPMPKRAAQWRPAIEMGLGFEFRDTEIRDKQVSPAARVDSDSGSTAAIVASVRPRLRRDSFRTDHSGFAVVDFDSSFALRKALAAGDFAFTQTQAMLGITATFGFRRSTDFLLRHRRGFGVTNGPAPLFQLLRLGGPDSVRGIEQGEYVGRYHAFEQSEAGISIQRLVEVFRPPKPLDSKAAKAVPKQSPLNLATTYVKAFYDRGFARDSASAADLAGVSHAAHGFGIAAEIAGLPMLKRRAALTIGYGYSPQSFLHRSGMVITGVSIDP